MYIINFGHAFAPATLAHLAALYPGATHIKVGVQLEISNTDAPSIEDQVLEAIRPHLSLFDGTERVAIVSPGMSNAAWCLAAHLHGLSGRFPELIELRMNTEKVFAFHRAIDLQSVRNETRKLRE